MKILKFTDKPKLDTALLIKQNTVFDANKTAFGTNYFISISKTLGAKIAERTCVIGTYHPDTGKVKKKEIVDFSDEIIEYCLTEGIKTLLVADSEYFKYFAGTKVFEKHIGESFECVLPECSHIRVLPMVNYQTVEMFPEKQVMLDACNAMAAQVMGGDTSEKKTFEFESYELVTDATRLEELFAEYAEYGNLACDIETTGLYVGNAELLTIAFAYDKYNAFTIPLHESYGFSNEIIDITKAFLKKYAGRFIFHNGLFDAKHLIYRLFMQDFSDINGMLEGINAIKFDDTFILAYLSLNSTVRPSLGLKDLSYDFLGDYAENVKDALSIPLEDLAIYNAKDVCGTFYVYEKFKAALDLEIYKTIMEPSFKPLLKMMLNGMPLDLNKVAEVEVLLEADLKIANETLRKDAHVQLATRQLRLNTSEKYNATHKTMKKTQGDFMDIVFNPNSSTQLRILLFDIMGFEPVDFTETKQPRTDRASIKEFLEYANVEQKPVLDALVTISQAGIVLNTFISAFKELSITQCDTTTLHGSLVLGGTQSGRLNNRLSFNQL